LRAGRPPSSKALVVRRETVASTSCASPRDYLNAAKAAGITAYLENGDTLEKARQMAAHASTRANPLYDRRQDRVTLDEVAKINIRGRVPACSTH
jgi:hypothetical protein